MARQTSDMTALVLAAGIGSRLRPITDTIPKAMVPLTPTLPLLEHVLRQLTLQGVRRFVINLHHHPEAIRSYFGNGARFGAWIEYSDESDLLLDTAGAVRKAAAHLSEDFLLVYADQLHFYDYAPLLALHRRHRPLATVTLKRSDLPQNGDLAEAGPDGRITRWYARPHEIRDFGASKYLNAGITVLSRRIVDHIPEGRPVSLDREVIPALVRAGEPVCGLPVDTEILDVGTPEKYEFAKQWFATQLDLAPRTRRALFLDRDGVILRELTPGHYLTDWSEAHPTPGISELVAGARELGYLVLVATNQPQIGRGLLTEAGLRSIHQKLAEVVGHNLDAIYHCPHVDEDGCGCRKPKHGLLERAAREWQVSPGLSFMVGDTFRDVGAAGRFGCRSVFLRNEQNDGDMARCQPDHVVSQLAEVLDLLRENTR